MVWYTVLADATDAVANIANTTIVFFMFLAPVFFTFTINTR